MSLQRCIQINRNNNEFPIPENPGNMVDFWLSGYCRVRLRKAAISDLSKMADIEGAQLGSLEKLAADDHI